jgi:uncharacterized protein (DUF2147 family)
LAAFHAVLVGASRCGVPSSLATLKFSVRRHEGYPQALVLGLGVLAKFILLLAAAVVATLAVYHFAVRPFSLARFFFGMKRRRPAAVAARAWSPSTALLFLSLALLCRPAVAATPVGLWYAEGGAAQVEISACGKELCGQVAWLRAPFDENGCDQRDRYNPDPWLRDRPLVGLRVLSGLAASPDDERAWTGGTIYDPASGSTYHCTLRLDGKNRLHIRGYIGIPLLGRTTTWIRVGSEQQMCGR